VPSLPALVPTKSAQWLWPAGLLATSGLATGLAGALVVAGALALAVGSRRLFPSLVGPVLWAVAVLLEFGCLSLSAMALPVATDGPVTRGVALAVLAFPVLVGAALGLTGTAVSRRAARRESDQEAAASGAGWSAVSLGPVAVFSTAWLLRSRGAGFSTAWAMSGDGRNHVTLIWSVIAHGGVTIDDLNGYPLMVDAQAAFLSAAGGRAGLAPGHLLIHDATALSDVFLLAAAALAALFTCALLETVANRPRAPSAVGRGTVLLSATLAGLLATTALVTGTALYGGAASAYGAAALAMAVIVLSLRAMTRPSAIIVLLIASGGPLLLTSWSVLALLVPPLVALVVVRGFLTAPRPALWSPAVIGATALGAGPLVVFVGKRAELTSTLIATGTIVGPRPAFLLVLALVCAGLVVTGRRWSRAAVAVPLTITLAGAVVIGWLMALGPGPMTLTYYATKTLWLVESLVVWVVFIPVVALSMHASGGPDTRATWRLRGSVVLSSAALLAFIGLATPLTNPVRSAWNGWNQPRAAGIAHLEQVADAGEPFVFWHWTAGGSQRADGHRIDRNLNDRILNFWSAALLDAQTSPAYDPALLPGGMTTWAVNAYGLMDQLCVLAKAVPGLVVVTEDSSLRTEFGKSCLGPSPTFRVGSGN
jgi:hypothetical protein